MFYFIKTPWFIKKIFSFGVWDMPLTNNKTVYLTFDDGPHPTITPFVLEELRKYKAKATFFCIGNNVYKYKNMYDSILEEGHAVGNHTQDHVNGWTTPDELYVSNIEAASKRIQSDLFRPPYGRMKKSQFNLLRKKIPSMKIIMWNVLSADFDISIDAEKCIHNVMKNIQPGSILVFHDSEKAFPRLQSTLPTVLKKLSEKGFLFEKIPGNLP